VERPSVVRSADLSLPPVSTPGLERMEAYSDEHVWVGLARTEPAYWSTWHVHPGHDTFAFAITGRLRIEFGPGGSETAEAGPGDFLRLPKGLVHREGNPGSERSELVVLRVGEGPPVVNVDGPDPLAR